MSDALANLDRLPRVELAMTPTPLVRLPVLERALAEELGRDVPQILLKQDAYTGFGLGGNKVRKLEYVLAEERLAGVTHLVTAGGVQSNHARVTAAAAARFGLRCVLVVNGEAPAEPRGNAKLQRLFGAKVMTVSTREERSTTLERVAEGIAASGGEALTIPIGASTPLGALGYARAAREFADQAAARGMSKTTIFIASSSCGTLAGLTLGFALLDAPTVDLVGVSADTPRAQMLEESMQIAAGAGLLLGWSGDLTRQTVDATDEYVGMGYGLATRKADRATELFGRCAGVVLDPTYTSKAAAGMLDWIRTGRVDASGSVVFWHTGGWPAAV
jgi:1-aminocyclopropane-1-carboxylate deaminase/D-cysteine desulfhydrase-like pyridoxal-dependent ACC family enzyme